MAEQPEQQLDDEKQRITTSFFNDFLNQKVRYANNQLAQVDNVFNKLGLNLKTNSNDLATQVETENDAINYQIRVNKSKVNHSNVVKWKYQQESVDELKRQNLILFIIFYILVIALGVIMYVYNTSNVGVQIVVFHVLLIWPFIIYYLELLIYTICKYIYAYSFGIPYDKVYFGMS